MPSPTRPAPIPAAAQPRRKKSGVLQSSLDLVFSYSRSQQLLYGKNVRSAPSFLETSSQSNSPHDIYLRDEEAGGSGYSGEHGDILDEGEIEDGYISRDTGTPNSESDTRKQSSAASPVIFTADPFTSSPSETDLTADDSDPMGHTTNQKTYTGLKGYGAINTERMVSTSSSGTVKPHTSHPGYRTLVEGKESRQEEARGRYREGGGDREEGYGERTPLLSEHEQIAPDDQTKVMEESSGIRRRSSVRQTDTRRRSSTKRRHPEMFRGHSTDGQTLFNAVAVLLGIGILSLPLAFAYAGWIAGTAMLISFAWLTCHTAKLLARLIKADPTMLGYTDIGRAAFGRIGGVGINLLFCLELFALGVALIVLFGDTLEVLYPTISTTTFKIIGLLIVLPTTLLPLHLLSLPSLLSTVSTMLLVVVILVNGFIRKEAPGSILHPAKTDLWPETEHANWLGGIGLILAGFGGHAVVPSLARDMRNPENFDLVIDWAFIIAAGVSFIAGAAGYLMIGNTVSDEITRDLMQPKYGYPRWLNSIALWMIVIIPLTKFGLCSRPLNIAIERLLGLTAPIPPPSASAISIDDDVADQVDGLTSDHSTQKQKPPAVPTYKYLRVITRTIVTCLCTLTAILLPGFGKVMAFLGSFSAFLICIILPLGFYIKLEGRLVPELRSDRRRIGHWALIVISCFGMVAGTVWAFLPGSGHGDLDP